MRINNNMLAMNTHRQLGLAQTDGSKSMEKLSSGFRINRAGDDAAGLSISEKMRAQIRGLNQASRNSQDGISLIQTAEGALNETHAILQRMRELATQSANDTNVGVDRGAIQNEMNQLTSEINRIGNTTEFNTQKLLKGDGTDAKLVGVDLKKAEIWGVNDLALSGGNITSAQAATLSLKFTVSGSGAASGGGSIAVKFGGHDITVKFEVTTDSDKMGKVKDGSITNGGKEVTMYVGSTDSSGTVTKALETGLKAAIAENANVNADDYVFTRNADTSGALVITTVGKGSPYTLATSGGTFATDAALQAASGDGGFADAGTTAAGVSGTNEVRTKASGGMSVLSGNISSLMLKEGFAALGSGAADITKFLSGRGFEIDGQTVEFYNSDNGEYAGKADFAVDLRGKLVDGNAGSGLTKAIVDAIGDKLTNVTLTNSGGDVAILAKEAGAQANSIQIKDGAFKVSDVVGSTFEGTFQIGANQGQSMTIEIGDMRAQALNIVGKAGTKQGAVSGAVFTATNNVTDGTTNSNYIAALDVSTHEKATAAVTVLNNAIEKVSAQRSKLGAFQNRLEHTIKNLDTSSENLQASESRIRDVDMAKEMMTFTKNNILSQAAQAMLAQANQAPQGVLQLLR